MSMYSRQQVKDKMTSPVGSGNPLLRVTGLSQSFGGQQVLRDVSLELHQGEVVLLRGANGSGKTTLLNILTGNLEPNAGSIELYTNGKAEEFRFPMSWLQKLNPWNHFTPEQVAQEGLGRTWQDIRLFEKLSLLDNIATATPKQLGENPLWALGQRGVVRRQEQQIRRDTVTLLDQLGLAGREKSSADMISLGQSKRVAIARAAQAGAKILFLDEPLAGLDAAGIRDVLGFLQELVQMQGLTLVIIEHVFNIPKILDLATTVWSLAEGQLQVQSVAKVRAEEKTDTLGEDGIMTWLEEVKSDHGEMLHQSLPGGAILTFVRPNHDELGEVLLEVEDLVVFRGKRLVIGDRQEDGTIQGLSFVLRRGELTVLQAPNGWGKTTLLEAITGLVPIKQGKIRVRGKPIQNLLTWERINLGLSFLQARENIFPSLRVREVFKLAKVHQSSEDFKELFDQPMSNLSGGEKQKVIVSCMVKGDSFKIGFLDEPFSALDQRSIKSVTTSISTISFNKGLLLALPNLTQEN